MTGVQTPEVDTSVYKMSYQTHTQLPKHVLTCYTGSLTQFLTNIQLQEYSNSFMV